MVEPAVRDTPAARGPVRRTTARRFFVLLYPASAVVGLVGAYIALISSLGRVNPVPDLIAGGVVMGAGLALSGVAVLGVRLTAPSWDFDGFVFGYLVLGVTLSAAALFSSGFRAIGDWERSPVLVAATRSECGQSQPPDGLGGPARYACTLTWTWDGVSHSRIQDTPGLAADGSRTRVWIDPSTGGAAAHDKPWIVASLICGFFTAVIAVLAWRAYIRMLLRARARARRLAARAR